MSATTSPSPETLQRLDQIHGLCLLADFLTAHPGVPVPKFETVWLETPQAVAEFVDDLDVLPIVDKGARWVQMDRTFGGLALRACCDRDLAGESTFTPFTITDVLQRAIDADAEQEGEEL